MTGSRSPKMIEMAEKIKEKHQDFYPIYQEMARIVETTPVTPKNVIKLFECAIKIRHNIYRHLGGATTPEQTGDVYLILKDLLSEAKLDQELVFAWRGIIATAHTSFTDFPHPHPFHDYIGLVNDLKMFFKSSTNEIEILDKYRQTQPEEKELDTKIESLFSRRRTIEQKFNLDYKVERKGTKGIDFVRAHRSEQHTKELAELKDLEAKIAEDKHNRQRLNNQTYIIAPIHLNAAQNFKDLLVLRDELIALQKWLEKTKPLLTYQAVIGATFYAISDEQKALNQLELAPSLDVHQQMANIRNILNKNHLLNKAQKAGFSFNSIPAIKEKYFFISQAKALNEKLYNQCKKVTTAPQKKRIYLLLLKEEINALSNNPNKTGILLALINYLKENQKNHLLSINTNSFTHFFGRTHNPNSNSMLSALHELENAVATPILDNSRSLEVKR